MAVKIEIPGIGTVEADNFAQEDTLQKLLAVMSKSEKTKQKDEAAKEAADKKLLAAKKKETEASKKQSEAQEKANNQLEDLIDSYEKEVKVVGDFGIAMAKAESDIKSAFADLTVTAGALAGKFLMNYDDMAANPIKAGAGILETINNVMFQIAHIGVDIGVALGKAAVGWVPFIGAGLADAVQGLGDLANTIIDVANEIFTTVNTILEKEFQKRADQLFAFAGIGGSFAGGMSQMAAYANQSGIGIAAFTKAVVTARPYITGMGMSVGDATDLISKTMGAMASTTGKSGRVVRDSLLALGYTFEQQQVIMTQYMAQQKAVGVNLANVAPATLARQTEEYAKHLKVISDITGQDAMRLMDQARAETQRGALMNSLTGAQANAFQDAYATLAAMPGEQGPKLQAALAQMLAGGVVTDPVIAGNRIIMDMLKTTAGQVQSANVNMVTATQKNLGQAAIAYRAAGESATDFAALMNPGGTSAVAQGMSQFGNALRQYRYDPSAAENSMKAANTQAGASDSLTGAYVGLTEVMTSFQNEMESLASSILPTYASVMESASAASAKFVTTGIKIVTGTIGWLAGLSEITGLNFSIPGLSSTMGGKAASADEVSNKGSGAGDTLAAAQGASTQAPTKGQGGSAEGDKTIDPNAKEQTATLKQIEINTAKSATALDSGTAAGTPKFADGGIASGPLSGYAATLHGTEAVVPLPDGKKLPVKMDGGANGGAMAQTMQHQTDLLNQILSAMQKNNTLTSGILQASQ